MMLDAKLTAGDKTILTRLALHLNLKTGRCDPGVGRLAIEVSIRGTDPERAVRRSLAKGEKRGWIRRTFRHGGDAKRQSQTNNYTLTIPDWTTGLLSPGEQIERPDKTTTDARTKCALTPGLQSPPNSEVENSEYRTAKLIAYKQDAYKHKQEAYESNFKGNPRQEGQEGKQASQSDTPTDSPSPSAAALKNPLPPISARPPLPCPAGKRSERTKPRLSDIAVLPTAGACHEPEIGLEQGAPSRTAYLGFQA